jgi:L-asparaginase II
LIRFLEKCAGGERKPETGLADRISGWRFQSSAIHPDGLLPEKTCRKSNPVQGAGSANMADNRPLTIEVTRGRGEGATSRQIHESRHEIDIIVADADGAIVKTRGDADRGVFPRSAIKALQALPLIESGAADAFDFAPKYLALACSSHNGEPFQTEAADNMLSATGLSPICLECGAQHPFHLRDTEALIRSGRPVTALYNNCSGKHAGFLAFAVHQGLPTDGYIHFGHPVQTEVAGALETVTGVKHGEDNYGIDGCSIPTYEIPLAELAKAYARFGVGKDAGKERSKAMIRLRDACLAHPEMVGGTERFDTQLMQALGNRAFTKTGAEGVFTIALPELGFGAALKCRDGTTRAAEVACAHLVESLLEVSESGLSQAETNALKTLKNPVLRNWSDFAVGEVRVLK